MSRREITGLVCALLGAGLLVVIVRAAGELSLSTDEWRTAQTLPDIPVEPEPGTEEEGAPEVSLDKTAPTAPSETTHQINSAIEWLRSQQRPDGAWEDGEGSPSMAATGLALMALERWDWEIWASRSPEIDRGAKWLAAQGPEDGFFGRSESPWGLCEHAIVTLALAGGPDAGSWSWNGVDAPRFGRVGATALMLMAKGATGTITGCFGGMKTLAEELGGN